MNDFENMLYSTVVHNSLLLLEEGVKSIIGDGGKFTTDSMVLACTNIQIALELAMRAYILRNKGLEYIIDKKQKKEHTDDEIEKLYASNQLKVIEFDEYRPSQAPRSKPRSTSTLSFIVLQKSCVLKIARFPLGQRDCEQNTPESPKAEFVHMTYRLS